MRCIAAGPAVERIWQDFRSSSVFQVFALDFWNGSDSSVRSFINQTGVTFPVLRGAGYLQSAQFYGILYDNIVIVDKDGIVRYTSVNEPLTGVGRFNNAQVRAAIQAYLPVAILGSTWSGLKELYR